MSGIYINDIEFPKEGDLVVIRPDGKAYYVSANPKEAYQRKAESVPPHGDLKDMDAVRERFEYQLNNYYIDDYGKGFQNGLKSALSDIFPVIIPADKET